MADSLPLSEVIERIEDIARRCIGSKLEENVM
jgi:hypothetical protein